MSSSETESENTIENKYARLGECEVCASNQAIYSCPKCEVKTCCLKCVQIHKKELECDGVRDRTKFIRMKDFDNTALLSDYRLLEECARFVHCVKKNDSKKFTRIDKDLPVHLYKLKMASLKRGIVLQFLAQNFTRHSINTTRYNYKTNIINWRVEWVFPNAEPEPVKFVDEKCSEHSRLSELLSKYLDPDAVIDGSKAISFYKSAGFSGIKVLLRAEKVKSSSKKFFELDLNETLMENLSGKCIVEFPIIFVVLKDHAYNFEIITPDDVLEPDTSDTGEIINENKKNANDKIITENGFTRKRKPLLTEKIANQKKIELEKELKEEKRKRPKNLLFTTGYSSEESIELSDEDNK